MASMEKEKPERPPAPLEVPARDDVRVLANRCPFCHEDVAVEDDHWVSCRSCQARHHADCWAEAGRCGACGDERKLVPAAAAAPLPQPEWFAARWGWQIAGQTVTAELSFVNGRERVWIDGRPVVDKTSFRFGGGHPLTLEDGRAALLAVSVNARFGLACRLVVDGQEVPLAEGQTEVGLPRGLIAAIAGGAAGLLLVVALVAILLASA